MLFRSVALAALFASAAVLLLAVMMVRGFVRWMTGLFAKAIVHPNKTAEQEPLPAQSNQIQGGADAPKEDTDHA